jgi:hypothetical protein
LRLFIRHKSSGEIDSVAWANVLPEGLEHPYVGLSEDEAVLEVASTAELEALAAHEIAERYTVDVKTGQLKSRGAAQPASRARRRRSES